MYNLLIYYEKTKWDNGITLIDHSRIFKPPHTIPSIAEEVKALNDDDLELLKSYPCLFAHEVQVSQAARFGWITDIKEAGSGLRIKFQFDDKFSPLEPQLLETLLGKLDIEPSFEANHSHWALKDVDLEEVFRNAGLLVAPPASTTSLKEWKDMAEQLHKDAAPFRKWVDSFHKQHGRLNITGPVGYTHLIRSMPTPIAHTKSSISLPVSQKPHLPVSAIPSVKAKVFIVHGRDDLVKHEVARYIEQLGLEAVILHEQVNKGRTIIEKFSEVAASVAFAVVLMTPDDIGGPVGDENQKHRARQNVIFELGFFIGKLGPNKVCALVSGSLEKPSDFDGVVYVPYHQQHASWKLEIGKELKAAGIAFNTDKMLL